VSASNLSTTPVRRRAETTSPPWLRLVPSVPVDAPRAPFIVFVIAVLGVGLVGLLLLNTSLQKRAFEVSSLQRSTAALADQQSELGQHAADLSAPESVAALAVELGMVPNKNPVFLRLSDGKVLGKPAPALRPEIIRPKVKAVPKAPAAKPKTATTAKTATATTKKTATKKTATTSTRATTQTGSSR
jgi:flagellar hook-length control protein FliK